MILPRPRSQTIWLLAGFVILGTIAFSLHRLGRRPSSLDSVRVGRDGLTSNGHVRLASLNQGEVPSLSGGLGWINSGPISLAELRGKIVLLDFWTFCCINCHHVLPDLAKLEAKYPNELVVIGVHTAKFLAEQDTENIRRKVAEYRIKHPVINDARMVLWRRFGVQSWPTLALIDANGQFVGMVSGEGHFEQLVNVIGKLVALHKERGELNLTPLKFSPEMERPSNGPLLYPGKVFADEAGTRLFISDTGHNRIIQAGLDGTKAAVVGDGEEGFEDGSFEKARFNRPQGIFLDGETLYVADTENHAIRAVDLKARQVSTVAGTGSQMKKMYAIPFSGPARTTALSSPWDIIQVPGDKALYIAMAGPHQIWKLDLASDTVGVFAGSGYENIQDGPAEEARFAQPSGLATDGQNLFVADSEVSGIRMITGLRGREPMVRTIVGEGLFEFGDHDGKGAAVRLQHCLGVAYGNGHLYIADTYNNKIKACVPKTHTVHTLVGAHKAGDGDNPPHFYEPGGVSVAGSELYVADTNNHKIRVVDLKSHAVRTIELADLSAPRPARRPPSFPNATVIDAAAGSAPDAAVEAAPGESLTLDVSLKLAKGLKLNTEGQMAYLVETPGKSGVLSEKVHVDGERIKPATSFTIHVPLARPAAEGETIDLRVSVLALVCRETSSVCFIKSIIWNVPVRFSTSRKPGEAVALSAPVAVGKG
jgi:thiol-disulfide isomerase/thioredoxin